MTVQQKLDLLFFFLVFGSIAAGIWSTIVISLPNFYGAQFTHGTCTLAPRGAATLLYNQTCDCTTSTDKELADTCVSNYPCFRLEGVFLRKSSSNVGTRGNFYRDYAALLSQCVVVPRTCYKKYTLNDELVRSYLHQIPGNQAEGDGTTKFECWGKNDTFYFTMKYTEQRAWLGVLIPVGCFLLSCVGACVFGSNTWNLMLCFPLVLCGRRNLVPCLKDEEAAQFRRETEQLRGNRQITGEYISKGSEAYKLTEIEKSSTDFRPNPDSPSYLQYL